MNPYMNAYSLPTSLSVGGVDFAIRTDFRAILDVLISQNDRELDDECKALVMLQILYKDWESIPQEHLIEACQKAVEFIDNGNKPNEKKSPRLVDWQQDAKLIIPAVNAVAKTEIRSVEYMHWWTFLAYYMEIRESLFSTVIAYRSNRAKHKKPEQWEKDFYKENKEIIDLKAVLTVEEERAKNSIEKWL